MKTQEEDLARTLLARSRLSWCDAVRLVIELEESLPPARGETRGDRMLRLRRSIRLGAEMVEREKDTVSVRTAIEASVAARAGRRPSTVADLRYLSRRLLRINPDLAESPMRAVSAEECRRCLERAFQTPSQFKKGRAFLHSVFSFGIRRGWCAANPVACVEVPRIREREIEPLTLPEIVRLTAATSSPGFRDCAPALGIMLWAGVRPCEVARLRWEDIDWEENIIIVRPRHSKTGGARHVSIAPVLRRWLAPDRVGGGVLCPPNWKRKWSYLRNLAGLEAWRQDTLRHTFASYHAKHFRDLTGLSLEMGHADLKLLRTRYINMGRLTRGDARQFWAGAWLGRTCRVQATGRREGGE